MNLSSIYTMKSLASALEINDDQTTYIPWIKWKNSSNFFFIAYDSGTIGRILFLIVKMFKDIYKVC